MASQQQHRWNGGFLSGEDLQDIVEDHAVFRPSNNDGKDSEENGADGNGGIHVEDGEDDNNKRLPRYYDSGKPDWNLDLALGEEAYLSSDEEIRILDEHESISIAPGEFALLITEEHFEIPPDTAAFISLRFTHALKGLINISGFHVDPNYKGRIVFSVYNSGPSPAHLRRGEAVFMIVFASLTQSLDNEKNRDNANYQDNKRLQADMLAGLQGRTTSLENLDDTVTKLQQRVWIISAILVGLVATLIGVALTQAISM